MILISLIKQGPLVLDKWACERSSWRTFMTQSNLEIYHVRNQNLQSKYKWSHYSMWMWWDGGASKNATTPPIASAEVFHPIYQILMSNIFSLNVIHVHSVPSILIALLFIQTLIIFHLASFYCLLMVLIYTVARMINIKCKPDHTIFSAT